MKINHITIESRFSSIRAKRKLIRLLVSKSIVSFEMSRVWGIEMLTVWTSKHRQANGCKDQSKLTFSPSSKVLLMVDMVATSSICSNSSAISGFHIPRGTLAAPPSAFSREKARRFGWVIWDLVGLFSHDIAWNGSKNRPNDQFVSKYPLHSVVSYTTYFLPNLLL